MEEIRETNLAEDQDAYVDEVLSVRKKVVQLGNAGVISDRQIEFFLPADLRAEECPMGYIEENPFQFNVEQWFKANGRRFPVKIKNAAMDSREAINQRSNVGETGDLSNSIAHGQLNEGGQCYGAKEVKADNLAKAQATHHKEGRLISLQWIIDQDDVCILDLIRQHLNIYWPAEQTPPQPS